MHASSFTTRYTRENQPGRGRAKAIHRALLATLAVLLTPLLGSTATAATHGDLVQLFKEWRAFEVPPLLNGAPDYTASTFEKRYADFEGYRNRLEAMDTSDWPVAERVDWHIVRAEMNGFEFNHKVLKPWVRDPAYYQTIWTYRSDVPAHEGPTHHAVLELWTYEFPLSDAEEERMVGDLAVIPPLMKQARRNLARATPATCGLQARATSARRANCWPRSANRPAKAQATNSWRRSMPPTRQRRNSSPGSRKRRPRRPALPALGAPTTAGTSSRSTTCP